VFAVSESEIDQSQSYPLGKAIEAFACPEDRKKRRAAEQDYLSSVKYVPAPEPSELEIAEWREANPLGLEAVWQSQQRERFEENRRKQAIDAAARLKELRGQRYASGLQEALRSGIAIAYGRLGSLQHPMMEIPAYVWNGEWEFQGSASIALGGAPHIEIYDVKVLPAAALQQKAGAPAAKAPEHAGAAPKDEATESRRPLPGALENKLHGFIESLGDSCGANVAWKKAEEHFNAKIPRAKIRELRKELGIKAPSRPR
jgi:hypothetical protein